MPTIKDLLMRQGEVLLHAPPIRNEFSGDTAADDLLNNLEHYPHAFVLACVMDRQMPAERAWLIPQRIAERLGNFDFSTLRGLTLDDVQGMMTKPTPLHRFKNKASVSFYEAVKRIANVCGGDASRIWSDRPPCHEVVAVFGNFMAWARKSPRWRFSFWFVNSRFRFPIYPVCP